MLTLWIWFAVGLVTGFVVKRCWKIWKEEKREEQLGKRQERNIKKN